MRDPLIIDAYLHAVYSFTRQGRCVESSFVPSSIPGASRIEIEGHGAWGIVSARNPMSRMLDNAAKERRDDELASILQREQIPRGPAEGRSPDGAWREPSRIILGVDRTRALELARRFEQRAVVWGERGRIGVLDCPTERWTIRSIYGLGVRLTVE